MLVDSHYLSHVLAVSYYSGHISHAIDVLKLSPNRVSSRWRYAKLRENMLFVLSWVCA